MQVLSLFAEVQTFRLRNLITMIAIRQLTIGRPIPRPSLRKRLVGSRLKGITACKHITILSVLYTKEHNDLNCLETLFYKWFLYISVQVLNVNFI